jgi:hypothetical protein
MAGFFALSAWTELTYAAFLALNSDLLLCACGIQLRKIRSAILPSVVAVLGVAPILATLFPNISAMVTT